MQRAPELSVVRSIKGKLCCPIIEGYILSNCCYLCTLAIISSNCVCTLDGTGNKSYSSLINTLLILFKIAMH